MEWFALGYAVQLVSCYLMIRKMYDWDDCWPLGIMLFVMLLPLFGGIVISVLFIIAYLGEKFQIDWDKIWTTILFLRKK